MSDSIYYRCALRGEALHRTIDEAVESYLERLDKPWPETITVHASRPMRLPPVDQMASAILDSVLDNLFCDYSYTKEDDIDPTPEMVAAAKAFAAVMHSEFIPHDCEDSPVDNVDVNVAEWIREHRPEWEEKAREA